MTFYPLVGAAYTNRSYLASAQRMKNLFTENTPNDSGEPTLNTMYQTPGTILISLAPATGAGFNGCRCAYTASDGTLWMVYGQEIYYVTSDWKFQLIGTMIPGTKASAVAQKTPVSITDNGTNLLVADGTADGWTIDLVNRNNFQKIQVGLVSFTIISANNVATGSNYIVGDLLTIVGTGGAQITVLTIDSIGAIITQEVSFEGSVSTNSPAVFSTTGGTGTGATFTLNYDSTALQAGWYGSTRVDFFDTFFLCNQPGFPNWFISDSNSINFNASLIAGKTSYGDPVVSVVQVQGNMWVIGEFTYELWDASSNISTIELFPYSPYPNALGDWGCAAPYSIAKSYNRVFWLAQGKEIGGYQVFMGEALGATRVSTYAIETDFDSYPAVGNATAYMHLEEGHVFYVLTFPSANNYRGKTWCYDATMKEWHERVWIDNNGLEYRHRIQCGTSAYGVFVGGDWENNNLYQFDIKTYTDFGGPKTWERKLPHIMDTATNNRLTYDNLVVYIQAGAEADSTPTLNLPIVESSFVDTSGTLLQNYFNVNDVGQPEFIIEDSSTTNLSIVSNSVIAVDAGMSIYQVEPGPTQSDYVIDFDINVSNVNAFPITGNSFYVIGRADVNDNGYQANVYSDGSNLFVGLNVMNSEVSSVVLNMGNVLNTKYEIDLSLQSTSIIVSAYRTIDGLWLDPLGDWTAVDGGGTPAIAIVDNTYVSTGNVFIGGNWI